MRDPLPHPTTVTRMSFAASGKRLITQSSGAVWSWDIPVPVPGDPERLALWVQVLTASELDERNMLRPLSPEEWQRRRTLLAKLGGPPAVSRTGLTKD